MRRNNLILCGVLAVFIGAVFFLMRNIPYGSFVQGFGPAFYPTVLLIALSVLLILFFIQTLRTPKESKAEDALAFSYKNFWFFAVLLLLYAISLRTIGFIINSYLFLVISMVHLKTTWRRSALISLATVGIIYVVFRIVLRVNLPSGILGVIGL